MKQLNLVHQRVHEFAVHSHLYIKKKMYLQDDGLLTEQVKEHRQLYGANELAASHEDIRHCLRRAFLNPFAVILFVLAAVSFAAALLFPDDYGHNLSTAFIIAVMLLLSSAVRLVQELQARRVAMKLTKLVDVSVEIKRDGVWQELPSSEIVVGDLIRLKAGDRVPADIRLVCVQDFFVSQSTLTGESGILEKNAAVLTVEPQRLSDYANTVFAGSVAAGGWAEGIAAAVGKDTVYGTLSPAPSQCKRGFDRGSNSIAWVLIKFMAVMVPVVFVASAVTKGSWLAALLFALSAAVGLTPELLPMVVNACLAKGSWQMGKKQTIVKNINAMQGFGSMDVLCVDKTGTLTNDGIVLEYYTDILGNESIKALEYAYINSCCHTGVYNHLDSAVLKCRSMPGHELYFKELERRYKKIDEMPFDYGRRFVSVLFFDKEEKKNILVVKGSVDAVAQCCGYAEYGGSKIALGEDAKHSIHSVVDEMTSDGMKVLAVAYKVMPKHCVSLSGRECDFILLGYLAFFDAPKKSAASAIKKLQQLQIDIRVLSGDAKDTTLSVCRRLGISTAFALTGAQMDNISDNELLLRIEQTAVFAELSPKQKAKIVKLLQDNGHSVGFLGDGMNDLPAQLQADVGISVDTAAEAVKESADVILLKKDLNVLEAGVLEGRRAFANMAKYIKITASSNFGNICSVIIAGVLLPFFPMLSVQLLLLGLLYDILCLILPWDNVDAELLKRPLEWSGRTLGRFMTFFGPLSSAFDVLTYAFLFFVLCPLLSGGAFAALDESGKNHFMALFQTGWFLESMWTQVLILHLLRTEKLPFVRSRPAPLVLLITIMGTALFTLLTISPLGAYWGMAAMPPLYYVFLVAVVLFYMLTVTLAKALYIRKYKKLL